MHKRTLCLFFLFLLPTFTHSEILRVDQSQDGDVQDGMLWSTAYQHLQDALSAAVPGDQIWVAKGLYFADLGETENEGDRNASFVLQEGVSLYGGFAGQESELTERNHCLNQTILCGDLEENDAGTFSGVQLDDVSRRDNSVRIIYAVSSDSEIPARLDGFTIRNGFSRTEPYYIRYQYTPGAGLYCDGASPIVVNCQFLNNYASSGGAIYADDAEPVVINCSFQGNFAAFGGAFSSQNSGEKLAQFHNCLFSGNHASFSGAAIWGGGDFLNCTFSGNFSSQGSILAERNNFVSMKNCIVWGNKEVSENFIHSFRSDSIDIQSSTIQQMSNGDPGWSSNVSAEDGDNTSVDPMFLDPMFNSTPSVEGDFRLDGASALLNSGTFELLPEDIADIDNDGDTNEILPYDLLGNSRHADGLVSKGAFQLVGPKVIQPVHFIEINASELAQSQQINLLEVFDSSVVSFSIFEAGSADIELITNDDGNTVLIQIEEAAIGLKRMTVIASDIFGLESTHIIDVRVLPDAIRVNANSTSAHPNGLTWDNAYRDLNTALERSFKGIEIWVAGGVYRPGNPGAENSSTFLVEDQISIYGGFSGTETQRSQRDHLVNVTVLSGDLNRNDITDSYFVTRTFEGIVGLDNATNVVTISNNISGALLDGFTITGGKAEQSNSIVGDRASSGGGLFVENGDPFLVNCVFVGNRASVGAAVYAGAGSAPRFEGCRFQANHSPQRASVYNFRNTLSTFSNCLFVQNSRVALGIEQAPNVRVDSCTFTGNGQSAIRTWSNGAFISNCIIWSNGDRQDMQDSIDSWQSHVLVKNSIVEGSGGSGSDWTDTGDLDLGGNLDIDPSFISENLMYSLAEDSPAIDAASVSDLLLDVTDRDEDGDREERVPFDLHGMARISGFAPDIGASEFDGSNLDSDHDGLSDAFELLYSVDDADADPDGDRYSNLEEFALGSDPTVADTSIGIRNIHFEDGYFHFSFNCNMLAKSLVRITPVGLEKHKTDIWTESNVRVVSTSDVPMSPDIKEIRVRSELPVVEANAMLFRLQIEAR